MAFSEMRSRRIREARHRKLALQIPDFVHFRFSKSSRIGYLAMDMLTSAWAALLTLPKPLM